MRQTFLGLILEAYGIMRASVNAYILIKIKQLETTRSPLQESIACVL